jgi:transcriptional regulator with XRE-family HTH domain
MTAQVQIEALAQMVSDKRAGRPLREVAAEIGIAFSTLQRVEAGGKPDLDTFFRLCRWLNVSADDFAPDNEPVRKPRRAQNVLDATFPMRTQEHTTRPKHKE